jgi:hypothetical protein
LHPSLLRSLIPSPLYTHTHTQQQESAAAEEEEEEEEDTSDDEEDDAPWAPLTPEATKELVAAVLAKLKLVETEPVLHLDKVIKGLKLAVQTLPLPLLLEIEPLHPSEWWKIDLEKHLVNASHGTGYYTYIIFFQFYLRQLDEVKKLLEESEHLEENNHLSTLLQALEDEWRALLQLKVDHDTIRRLHYAGAGYSEMKAAFTRIFQHLDGKKESETALAAAVIKTFGKNRASYGVLFTTKMIEWIADKLDPDDPPSMMRLATAICEAITAALARANVKTGGLNVASAGMFFPGNKLVEEIWRGLKERHTEIKEMDNTEERMAFCYTLNAVEEFQGKQNLLDAVGVRYPRRTDVTVGEMLHDICAAGGRQSHTHTHTHR